MLCVGLPPVIPYVFPMFFQCYSYVFSMFFLCFLNVFPMFSEYFSYVFPMFFLCFFNVFPMLSQCLSYCRELWNKRFKYEFTKQNYEHLSALGPAFCLTWILSWFSRVIYNCKHNSKVTLYMNVLYSSTSKKYLLFL